ncbi:carbonic anhydrase [Caballeronia sp. SEWSISQ10-4 2]|uniref:carbonic anhydrase n=1 Tax=Caballeronia sp. SEWSISQ10-4 2 TaxID=2937438 RepID=UPI00264E9F90|nr:carbonic anhydrase [Caballeronia sp. SEWSISQ10-4 2]MDN7180031.1 carbonic anhydrase [Caballeronia sp. SEWSISQ10-4 2]
MCVDPMCSLSRRRVLFAGLASATVAAFSLPDARADESSAGPGPNAIAPAEALSRLLQGNSRYVANAPSNKDYSAGRATRAAAQYPIAAIVGCADSRVSPELAFDQGPGDLFVVRVAGNFVNDDGLASLEYGVKFLGVPLIMVLGHTNCGAVSAAVKAIREHAVLPGHLPELVQAIRPAIEIAKAHGHGDLVADTTIENVRLNANRLRVSKPLIGEYVRAGKVQVVGAIYDLASGKVGLVE